MEQLIPLVVGFLLTTVLGGLIGFLLQGRAWSHQHRVIFAEHERERAVQVFEEVSRLLDRRLYRLRLILWSLGADPDPPPGSSSADERMREYRNVLYEWNDSINRNLALVQAYFGERMRRRLDEHIGERFVQLGREVQQQWRTRPSDRPSGADPTLELRMHELGQLVYDYNLDMIHAIQSGEVGVFLPERGQQG